MPFTSPSAVTASHESTRPASTSRRWASSPPGTGAGPPGVAEDPVALKLTISTPDRFRKLRRESPARINAFDASAVMVPLPARARSA